MNYGGRRVSSSPRSPPALQPGPFIVIQVAEPATSIRKISMELKSERVGESMAVWWDQQQQSHHVHGYGCMHVYWWNVHIGSSLACIFYSHSDTDDDFGGGGVRSSCDVESPSAAAGCGIIRERARSQVLCGGTIVCCDRSLPLSLSCRRPICPFPRTALSARDVESRLKTVVLSPDFRKHPFGECSNHPFACPSLSLSLSLPRGSPSLPCVCVAGDVAVSQKTLISNFMKEGTEGKG